MDLPPPLPPVDLLSSLPEHLQDEILTRLGLRDAVRTSAISRAWRRRWETLPGLVLSFPDGTPPRPSTAYSDATQVPTSPGSPATSTHASAIDRVLRRYAGPNVSRFACHVDACASQSLSQSQSHVDDWLIALSRRSVESISILNQHAGWFTVHPSIFFSDHLGSLSLEGCWIPPLPQLQPGGGFAGFPVLKELYLTFVAFAADKETSQLQDIIRASPMLRVLLEEVYVAKYDTDCVIEAPNIHTLGLISSYIHWRFGDPPRLRYASINLGHRVIQGGPAGCLEFLAGVSQVQELIFNLPLCDFKMDAIPFTFSNLKNMELSTDFAYMHRLSLMFCLLRSSQNLEKLKIEVQWSNYKIVNHEFLNAQWIDGICANLRVVEIISCNGWWLPLDFMELILSKASCLRTLSVDACPVSQYSQLNVLLNCRRASPQAKVLLKVQLAKISFNRMKFAEKKRLN